MTEVLLIDETVQPDGEVIGHHDVPDGRRGFDWTYYIDADEDAENVDIEWRIQSVELENFYHLPEATRTNQKLQQFHDATAAYNVDIGTAKAVQIVILNKGADSFTVSAEADISFR